MNLSSTIVGGLILAACVGLSADAQAQCGTCATPTVAYSPVIYQNTTVRQGWYPGYYLGRVGQRIFGTAPVPQTAYYSPYATAVPQPYAAGYAPVSAYSTGYAPTYAYAGYAPTAYTQTVARPVALAPTQCDCVQQTAYRPVTLAPAGSTCNACDATTSNYSYAAPASSGCSTCGTDYASSASYDYVVPSGSSMPQPSLAPNETAPPSTYRKEPTMAPLEPEPANDVGADEASTGSFQAPKLWNPRDRVTLNAPAGSAGTPVWQAVYRQPVESQQVSQPAPSKSKLQWVAGK